MTANRPPALEEALREAHGARVRLYQAHDKAIRYCRCGVGSAGLYDDAQAIFDAALVSLELNIDLIAKVARL